MFFVLSKHISMLFANSFVFKCELQLVSHYQWFTRFYFYFLMLQYLRVYLDKLKYFWTHLIVFGYMLMELSVDGIWMHLDAFGCIWMPLDAFGCIWMHLKVFECISEVICDWHELFFYMWLIYERMFQTMRPSHRCVVMAMHAAALVMCVVAALPSSSPSPLSDEQSQVSIICVITKRTALSFHAISQLHFILKEC